MDNFLNIVFVSYGEIKEICERIKFIEPSCLISVHVFETSDASSWQAILKTSLKKYDVNIYHVEPKPFVELHWLEVLEFGLDKNCLFLCADEQMKLTRDVVEEILLCETASFPRRNYIGEKFFKGSGLGEHQDLQIRFFRNLRVVDKDITTPHVLPFVSKDSITLSRVLIRHFAYRDMSDVISRFDRYTEIEADACLRDHALPYLVYRSVKHFLRRYFVQKGFRDGLLGFIFCCIMALYIPIINYKSMEKRCHWS